MRISKLKSLASTLAIAVLCITARAAYSQQTDPAYSLAGNDQQVQPVSMNTSLAGFEARLNAIEAAMAEEQQPEEPQWTEVGNEKWSHKVGGRVFGDYVLFSSQDAASQAAYGDLQNYFEMRRMWLFISGKGFGVYDYKMQVDFEPEPGHVAMKDVWVGIDEIPVLGYLRFGNFKEPFSMEELTSSKYISFLERSLPVVLWAPSRRVGVAAYRHTESLNATLAYGAFFNDISTTAKERIGDAQGVDLAIRSTWLPYYGCEGRSLLHVGGGYVYRDDRDDSHNFRSRPEVHEGEYFVRTGDLDLRDYQSMNLELASVYGPFSVQSELFYTQSDGILGTDDMDFYGGYVFFSYFLTGENRPYNRTGGVIERVKPFTNFWIVPTSDGPRAGWGAWELLTRYSFVDLQNPALADARRGQLHDITVGANWYWNPNTRMMFNWIHAYGDLEVAGLTDTDILSMRLQVDF